MAAVRSPPTNPTNSLMAVLSSSSFPSRTSEQSTDTTGSDTWSLPLSGTQYLLQLLGGPVSSRKLTAFLGRAEENHGGGSNQNPSGGKEVASPLTRADWVTRPAACAVFVSRSLGLNTPASLRFRRSALAVST